MAQELFLSVQERLALLLKFVQLSIAPPSAESSWGCLLYAASQANGVKHKTRLYLSGHRNNVGTDTQHGPEFVCSTNHGLDNIVGSTFKCDFHIFCSKPLRAASYFFPEFLLALPNGLSDPILSPLPTH